MEILLPSHYMPHPVVLGSPDDEVIRISCSGKCYLRLGDKKERRKKMNVDMVGVKVKERERELSLREAQLRGQVDLSPTEMDRRFDEAVLWKSRNNYSFLSHVVAFFSDLP